MPTLCQYLIKLATFYEVFIYLYIVSFKSYQGETFYDLTVYMQHCPKI